jgi:hypothetical protein
MGILYGSSHIHVLSVIILSPWTDGALAERPGRQVPRQLQHPTDQHNPNRCTGGLGGGSAFGDIIVYDLSAVEHLLHRADHLPYR